MDSDTHTVVVGLAAGLGGFAGLLLIMCICWHICCGSWCEKETVRSSVRAIPTKTQRRTITTTTTVDNNISTITPVKSAGIYPDSKPSSSNDLASKIKSRCQ